ncbi:MAG: hypothetical protein NE328_06945 [Lentisphaeraceae bacterium]|nr:hypothetical protein [Lentisphaeraceae bacterium]
MNKKLLWPILALIIYAVIIWPKGDLPEKEMASSETSKVSANPKKETTPRAPQRGVDPNFKPEVVKAQEPKEDEKFFRTTAPEAIAYAENERIALEVGPGETLALSDEQISQSPQLQSVVKAMSDPKEKGSHVSPLIKAKPFDKSRFSSDANYREKYLNSAEPGRVYQVDSKSQFKLARQTPYYQEVVQGESVNISVQAEPNMPVSITSFDLGKFANHLTYQTVLADSSGTAIFEFFGMPGTFNDSKILVSSPTSRGQLKFVVRTKIKTENSN